MNADQLKVDVCVRILEPTGLVGKGSQGTITQVTDLSFIVDWGTGNTSSFRKDSVDMFDVVTDTIRDQSREAQEFWLRHYIDDAKWTEVEDNPGRWEFLLGDVLLCWVTPRPHFCDRGHYQGGIEFSPGNPFDFADGMPCYYMRLDVARQDIVEKMMWRVCKVRIE